MSESENKCRHGFATSDDCCAICALEADVEATKDVLADTQTELEDLKADIETMQNISSELATDNERLRTHLSAVQAELERYKLALEQIASGTEDLDPPYRAFP